MNRMAAITVLAIAVASLALGQGAQQKPAQASKAEQELLKLEREWAEAIVKRDLAFIERVYAEEYTFTDPEGVVFDKKGDLEQLRSGAVAIESLKLDDLKVRVYGETAVVTGRGTVKGKVKGKDISGQDRVVDVFVMRDGRWQCVHTQLTRIAKS